MRSLRSRHRDGLVAATVRVLTHNANGDVVESGTGFFVAPGRVITCAHVLPELPNHTYAVECDGTPHPAIVAVRDPKEGASELYSYPDVALLTVDVTKHPCAPLGLALPEAERELYSYGCPSLGNDEPFWDHVSLRSEGERRRASNSEVFLKTKGGQVQPGASGSGVVDVDTGEVVGMLVQTRDKDLDLGGVAVPTSVILDRLAARGHDLAEANRAATRDADTLAAANRRLGKALRILVDELANAEPPHLRTVLMALHRDSSGPLTVEEVALALLNLELNDLGTALRELAHASHSALLARRVLNGAVPFAWIAGRPWAEPDTARRLAVERERDRPRAVHLPACPRSVRIHAGRAAVTGRWTVFAPAAPGGDSGEVGGLPTWLVRAVQLELLDMLGVILDDPDDAEEIDRVWAERGAEARADHGKELLVLLPAGIADTEAVDALRGMFAPCVFVVADRTLSGAMRGSMDVLALRASLSAQDEAKADRRFGEINTQINRAAGQGA